MTQNSELREIGAYNWTLPALHARLSDGTLVKTCPSAGACAQFCYARNGTFRFPAVKAAHVRNLELVLTDLDAWRERMTDELRHKRYVGKHVRIHDSGDFFTDEYTAAWLRIASDIPTTTFYAYTKEVARFKRMVEGRAPANFLWLYSMGGREDHLVDLENDRHAEVFPSEQALADAGYFNQEESDLLAVHAPTNKIGIVANNIPAYKKRMGERTFGSVQSELDRRKERAYASTEA